MIILQHRAEIIRFKRYAPESEELGFPGASRELDGGAAILLEMPLNPDKKLSHLVLETLSNDVVIGLMGITLQR